MPMNFDESNVEKHRERHDELHQSLDELLADFINHTGRFPSKTTVSELLSWSYEQTQNPTTRGGDAK